MSHTGVAKVTISLPRDLLARADAARGDEPRSTWIARTLGAALAADVHGKSKGTSSPPAPRRAPDDGPNLRAAYAMDRQAKLNAAKYGRKS